MAPYKPRFTLFNRVLVEYESHQNWATESKRGGESSGETMNVLVCTIVRGSLQTEVTTGIEKAFLAAVHMRSHPLSESWQGDKVQLWTVGAWPSGTRPLPLLTHNVSVQLPLLPL